LLTSSFRTPKFVVVPVGWGHFSYLKLRKMAAITDGGTMRKCYRVRDPFILQAFEDLIYARKLWIFSHFHFDHYSLMAAFQKVTTTSKKFSNTFLVKGDHVAIPYLHTPECRMAIANVTAFLAHRLIEKLPGITKDEAIAIIAPWLSEKSSVKLMPVRAGDRIILTSKDASFEYLFLSPNPALLREFCWTSCREISEKINKTLDGLENKDIFSTVQQKTKEALERAHEGVSREPATYRINADEEGFEENLSEVQPKSEVIYKSTRVVDALSKAQVELKKVLKGTNIKSLNNTSLSYALTWECVSSIIYLSDLDQKKLLQSAIYTFIRQKGLLSSIMLFAPHHGNAWCKCLRCLEPVLTVFTRCDAHYIRWRSEWQMEYDQLAPQAYVTHNSSLEFCI
jgi:hypothetical protein